MLIRDIAIQRMWYLFNLAYQELKRGDIERCRRYIDLILRIAKRVPIKVPRGIKRRICKQCKVLLVPGVTARYRIQSEGKGSRLVVTCLLCGYIRRFPIKLKRQQRK